MSSHASSTLPPVHECDTGSDDGDDDTDFDELYFSAGSCASLRAKPSEDVAFRRTTSDGTKSKTRLDTVSSDASTDFSCPPMEVFSEPSSEATRMTPPRSGRVFDSETLDQSTHEDILTEVRMHLDTTQDVLAAEALLSALKARVTSEEWSDLANTEVVREVGSRLEKFYGIGKSCCLESDEWFVAVEDRRRGMKLECMIAPGEAGGPALHYRLKAAFNAKITKVVALSTEVEYMHLWHPLISQPPELTAKTSPFSSVFRYQTRLLGGMYRADVLNEVTRFLDPDAGFAAEAVVTVSCTDEHYRPPLAGFRRLDVSNQRLWVAVGEADTLMIQAGVIHLPVSMNRAIAARLARSLATKTLKGFRRGLTLAGGQDNVWERAIDADAEGLYAMLDLCAHGLGSRQRARKARAASSSPFGGLALADSLRPDDIWELFCHAPGSFRRRTMSDEGVAAVSSSAGGQKSVTFRPSEEVHSIPDRAGHMEEYRFLAEQHNRLDEALAMTLKLYGRDEVGDKVSRLSSSLVEMNAGHRGGDMAPVESV